MAIQHTHRPIEGVQSVTYAELIRDIDFVGDRVDGDCSWA